MAPIDLIPTNDRIVTSQGPQSSVSPGQVAAPYRELADNLTRVGEVTDDLAVRAAKDQAAEDLNNQRVTLGPDGQVSVTNPVRSPLLFGQASAAYEHAIQEGNLAQFGNVIAEKLNDFHQKFQASPGQFKAAASQWGDDFLAKYGQGEPGQLLRRQFDQQATQHFNAITDLSTKISLKQQDSALSASMEGARGDLTAMLRGGASLDDPAVKQKFDQYDRAVAARQANPLFGYSAEQAALDRANFHGEAAASRFLFDVDQTYKSTGDGGGYAGAMKKAETILTDPRFGMSQQLREQYYHRAAAEVRANEASRRQSVSDATAAFRELEMVSAAGGRIGSDDVETIAKSYIAAGDPSGAARVRSAFIRKPLNDDYGRQPIAVQTQQLAAMHGLNAAGQTYQSFISKGYSPAAAAGIVGNLVQENSSLDTAATGDNGTSGGLAQFHNERLTALKKFAADRGKPWTDFQTQVDFIDNELHTTESGTLAKLQAAKTPEDAAAAFIGYERPKGWTPDNPAGGLGFESRQRQARAIFDRKFGDTSMGPAGSLWLEANHANTLNTAAATEWSTIVKAFDKEGIVPSVQKVTDLVNAATVTRNAPLLDQIAHDAARIDAIRNAGRESLPDQGAQIGQLQSMASRGVLDPATATVLSGLEKRKAAIEKGLDDNPVTTTAANFPDRFASVPTLDLSNSDNFRAGLQARGKIVAFGAKNWQVPPRAALDDGEVQAVRRVLSTATPDVKARMFGDITAALPEPERMATFAKLGQQTPEAMIDAFAGGLYGRTPNIASGVLTGWQAMKADPRFDPMKDDKSTFNAKFDDVLPATAFAIGGRTSDTGALATIRNAARAYYAFQSAQIGDTSGEVDERRVKDAVQAVTGGVLKHNGGSIVAPARGMTQNQFDGVMAGITDADLAGVTTLSGKPVTADYLRDSAQLESTVDGRYLVRLGQNPTKPIYAFRYANTEMPQPFELDLRGRRPLPVSAWPRVEFKPYPRG